MAERSVNKCTARNVVAYCNQNKKLSTKQPILSKLWFHLITCIGYFCKKLSKNNREMLMIGLWQFSAQTSLEKPSWESRKLFLRSWYCCFRESTSIWVLSNTIFHCDSKSKTWDPWTGNISVSTQPKYEIISNLKRRSGATHRDWIKTNQENNIL